MLTVRTSGSERDLNSAAAMRAEHIVAGPCWRIGIITDELIRFEWSDSGVFIDDTTQIVMSRSFGSGPVHLAVRHVGSWIEIETDRLEIRFNQERFSSEGLWVSGKPSNGRAFEWHYGALDGSNLGGTARTLDEADGAIPLEPGIVSSKGWAVLDDSRSNIVRQRDDSDDLPAPMRFEVASRQGGGMDFYLFAYGRDYKRAVRDYFDLTGPPPLLPRFALGNWWSRYHAYDEGSYKTLITRMEDEGLPFTVAVLDMDWHLVDIDPQFGSGWTGFTWNRELFPDPKGFLSWLSERGLRTALNVHPADGIREFEDQYIALLEALGRSSYPRGRIPFEVTSSEFMTSFFGVVNHPLEDDGVDFWWLDWQQGSVTDQPGMDPLWMLNFLYFEDAARRGQRPLILSRYAGPGSHRFPVGFSGDAIISWESLAFQPVFTASASNIGYGWWSHDIGGHMAGSHDEELLVRWVQFGIFSPILRLHSNDSLFNGKEPWNFGPVARPVIEDSLRLRHRLIPYLYSMNHRASIDGVPLVEPMYWEYPELPEAYGVPHQYFFGSEMFVVPITTPIDESAMRASVDCWFPQGNWFDLFDGRCYRITNDEGQRLKIWRAVDRIPVFVKAGGIIPLQGWDDVVYGAGINSIENPADLSVLVFPGADGEFQLWEDDGGSESSWACTNLSWKENSGSASAFSVSGVGEPSAHDLPESRNWCFVFRGIGESSAGIVRTWVGDSPFPSAIEYDSESLSLSVRLSDVPTSSDIRVVFQEPLQIAEAPLLDDVFRVLRDARMPYVTKDRAFGLVRQEGVRSYASMYAMEDRPVADAPRAFSESHMPQAVREAISEILFRST